MTQLEEHVFLVVDNEEHMEALRQAIIDNDLVDDDENEKYTAYSPQNKGCSKENPFVINEASPLYIPLERYIIEYLFGASPMRVDEYKIVKQSLVWEGGRSYDCIEIEVTPWGDCDILFEDDEDNPNQDIHIETYWFDITAGITACRPKHEH
ncbi:MAG: hypothetical protein MJZ35_02740 [Bacteroidaceae bacterium]|nr:hypothetical protein [Bacteroidaceae bacterium]